MFKHLKNRRILKSICLAFILHLFFFLQSNAFADIYGRFGYAENQDGILLLTDSCSGKLGDAGFRKAYARSEGRLSEGCYVKNDRDNFIVKWDDGTISELPSNQFLIENPSQERTPSIPPQINWDEYKPLYIYIEGEDRCFRNEGGMLLAPWGNIEEPQESREPSSDSRSMTLIGRFSDGQITKIHHYLSMDECQKALENK